jgi:hypothetical protein
MLSAFVYQSSVNRVRHATHTQLSYSTVATTIPFVVCSLYCFGCSAGTARALHRRALGAGGDPRAVPPHVLCARRSAGIAHCGQSDETNSATPAQAHGLCVHSLWTRLSTLSTWPVPQRALGRTAQYYGRCALSRRHCRITAHARAANPAHVRAGPVPCNAVQA